MQDGRRPTYNADLRSSLLDGTINGYVEFTTPAENSLNSDWWTPATPPTHLSPNTQTERLAMLSWRMLRL
jgi:hypothetical protein